MKFINTAVVRPHERDRRRFAQADNLSGSTPRRFRAPTAVAVAVAAASLLAVAGTQFVGIAVAEDLATDDTETGFSRPFSGPERFEFLAPTQATSTSQINEPIGLVLAHKIAQQLRLDRDKVLTFEQFRAFITGGGVPGSGNPAAAKLADESVKIFINTSGFPLRSKVKGKTTKSVLGSYGLFVTKDGWLESLANNDAPTRIANSLLVPPATCDDDDPSYCGYIDNWFRANNATEALEQLYASAYTVEAFYGFLSQQLSQKQTGEAQLVTNTKGDVSTRVGMSMAPSLWLTNFALLYTPRPEVAAEMPAYWTPIPENVAHAIERSPIGRVRYSRFESEFIND